MSLDYLVTELRRMFRNTRFVIFAVAFPVLMFLLQANLFLNGTKGADKAAAVGVIMINMMVFGTLAAAIANGGKLAVERSTGWQRQLRLTPLSGAGYMGAKAVSGLLLGLPALLLVPALGVAAEHVHLSALQWVETVGGVWLGSIPLMLLGLLLGQFGTPETMQPLNMLVNLGLGFLGGLWIPIDTAGWVHEVAQFTPTYWLTQLVRGMFTRDLTVNLGTTLAVLGVWTVVFGGLVARRYLKDSARV
jgi:ABC-2 type transport system permease protein